MDKIYTMNIKSEGHECYTGNDFVTATDKTSPVLFDIELNYIGSHAPIVQSINKHL